MTERPELDNQPHCMIRAKSTALPSVALVNLQRQRRLGMTGIDADHRQTKSFACGPIPRQNASSNPPAKTRENHNTPRVFYTAWTQSRSSQGRQERDQMSEAVVPQGPRQRRPAAASRLGLQSRQLHADVGLAEGGGALVADHATGLSGIGGQGWSRSAPKLSATAGTSRSNWPRLPCRSRKILSLIDDLRRRPAPA